MSRAAVGVNQNLWQPITAPLSMPARLNPLRVERLHQVPFIFANHDWNYHLQQLQRLSFRAAIVGRQGSGKSTLLRELHSQLNSGRPAVPASCYLFVPHESHSHSALISQGLHAARENQILLLDGIERLSIVHRCKVLYQTRHCAGLVVCAHRPVQFPLRLSTWLHCRTTPDLMLKVLHQLGLNEESVQTAALQAYDTARGNLRVALRDLYDCFAAGKFNPLP